MRRIIPARAGFTIVDYLVENRERDHPRSRGVYYATYTGSSVACGSSPLARGLPRDTRPVVSSPGIIPARAGFTTRVTARIQFGPDHPRSRGVYRRGILPLRPRRRIIPARAGFTGRRTRPRHSRQDHPRSRGVYPGPRRRGGRRLRIIPARAGFTVAVQSRLAGHEGSSPLARGLPHAGAAADAEGGIIPARAGFTQHCT